VKTGRPRGRSPRNEARATHRITVRLNDDEFADVARQAATNQTSVADVVRVSLANTSRDSGDEPSPLVLGDGRVVVFVR
jgi:hypothetical protein